MTIVKHKKLDTKGIHTKFFESLLIKEKEAYCSSKFNIKEFLSKNKKESAI